MKKTIILIILLISFSIFAEDISDFEIEKMSVGDSLLDYFSEDEIILAKTLKYNDNKFYIKVFDIMSENYDLVRFQLKQNDMNYIIYGTEGIKFVNSSSINDCLNLKDSIVDDISKILSNYTVSDQKKRKHASTKNMFTYNYYFILNDGSKIAVSCYDWTTSNNDYLQVGVMSQEFIYWLNNKAHK